MGNPGLGRNYWKLWAANVVSNFGDGVGTVAYPWLASALTRNPLHIALVSAATRLPWLIVTLPAGLVADRVDRRRLVGYADVFRSGLTLALALIVLANQGELAPPSAIDAGQAVVPPSGPWLLALLYGAALGLGTAEVLRDNGAQTLLPSVVAKDQLQRANGQMWGAEAVAGRFLGPPAAGVLLAAGFALPFFVDATTFAAAAVAVLALRGSFRPDDRPDSSSDGDSSTGLRWRAEIAEGFAWLWHHPVFRTMAIILGLMNALGAAAIATYVLFVQEVLGLSAGSFGLLLTSGALGGALGSVTAARLSRLIGSGPSLFVTLGGTVLTMSITAVTSSAAVVWVMFGIFGYVSVLWNVITVSLRQAVIPDYLLGRVNSVYRLFAWGAIPLGAAFGGLLVDVTERLADRDLALRTPFAAAAVAHLVLLAWAVPTLNSERLESARTGVHLGR